MSGSTLLQPGCYRTKRRVAGRRVKAQAAQDLAAIAAWVKASSPGKFRALMESDWVFPAPFAALLPIDPDAPAGPQVDLSKLAEGGLVFLVPDG